MKRNLIVLGCTALLTIGLSFGSFAGSAPDADGDGVPDDYDNCVNVANGPLASTGNCDAQEDYNTNGYGQVCDADLNEDGGVGLDDMGVLLNALGSGAGNTADLNCDNGVGLDDMGTLLNALGSQPGPSGLACAAPDASGCTAQ
jgi:hypothetical protein